MFTAPGRTSVSFIELAGDACSDMLNGGKPLRLVTGADGYTHPHPAVEPRCESAEDLIALIKVCSDAWHIQYMHCITVWSGSSLAAAAVHCKLELHLLCHMRYCTTQ
jgi:hypothetical protein